MRTSLQATILLLLAVPLPASAAEKPTAPLIGNPPQAKATARAFVEPGRAYAIYVRGGTQATLELALPAGKYRAEWINTKTGAVDKKEGFQHNGGTKQLSSPPYQADIGLRIHG